MLIRKNLAYAYQILAKLKMADHTYTHLSAREAEADHYYINSFGYRFEEVTKYNLLKVSLQGRAMEEKEIQHNETGQVIHGSIYAARQDIHAIFHLHTVSTVAVSCMKDGLLPISQWALHFYGQINYHEYNSLALDNDVHGKGLIEDLGNKKVLFLRNHGFIACGATIHEALFYTYHLELACQTQIAALASGAELIVPDRETCLKANHDLLNFEKDLGFRDWQAWLRWIAKPI